MLFHNRMLFCNPYLFLSQILFFNKNLSFFDMQIKSFFESTKKNEIYLSKNNKKGMFFNKHTKSILKNETAGSIIAMKEWQ